MHQNIKKLVFMCQFKVKLKQLNIACSKPCLNNEEWSKCSLSFQHYTIIMVALFTVYIWSSYSIPCRFECFPAKAQDGCFWNGCDNVHACILHSQRPMFAHHQQHTHTYSCINKSVHHHTISSSSCTYSSQAHRESKIFWARSGWCGRWG